MLLLLLILYVAVSFVLFAYSLDAAYERGCGGIITPVYLGMMALVWPLTVAATFISDWVEKE